MSSLGSDIIFGEILPRLPVKSLMRFKCVSKSFQTLISSRQFIQLYLRHYSTYSDDLFVIPKDGSIICYDLNSSTPFATFSWQDSGALSIIGSCNGLVCICPPNAYHHFTLLNPTSRVFKIVDITNVGDTHGFAFDSVNLDFKIVSISEERNRAGINCRITKVYSVNTDSITKLDTEFPPDSIDEFRNGVVVNNNLLHWMFWRPSLRIRRIGCFDVYKMNWTDDVLLPRHYYDPTYRNFFLDIGVLDGLFCSTFDNKVDSCFHVWVMTEYGVQDSWFKLFSIPISKNLQEGVIPVASRRRSVEVLIHQRSSSKFYWYNSVDNQMSNSKFDGVLTWSYRKTYICNRSMIELSGGRLFKDRYSLGNS